MQLQRCPDEQKTESKPCCPILCLACSHPGKLISCTARSSELPQRPAMRNHCLPHTTACIKCCQCLVAAMIHALMPRSTPALRTAALHCPCAVITCTSKLQSATGAITSARVSVLTFFLYTAHHMPSQSCPGFLLCCFFTASEHLSWACALVHCNSSRAYTLEC